ncbi:MAG: substrate-binding domain-containing protein, partial [Halobacteria archaeon]|nr:substrate-binding domain-containing protein [Halobacteria archaeon]
MRWINRSAAEGARKIRDGIADVAGVNLSVEELSKLGIEDAYLVRGYEREVGIMGVGKEELEDEDGDSVVAVPWDTECVNEFLDGLDADIKKMEAQTYDNAVKAVERGDADAGITLRYAVETGFEPLYWESFDFLVSDERA